MKGEDDEIAESISKQTIPAKRLGRVTYGAAESGTQKVGMELRVVSPDFPARPLSRDAVVTCL